MCWTASFVCGKSTPSLFACLSNEPKGASSCEATKRRDCSFGLNVLDSSSTCRLWWTHFAKVQRGGVTTPWTGRLQSDQDSDVGRLADIYTDSSFAWLTVVHASRRVVLQAEDPNHKIIHSHVLQGRLLATDTVQLCVPLNHSPYPTRNLVECALAEQNQNDEACQTFL